MGRQAADGSSTLLLGQTYTPALILQVPSPPGEVGRCRQSPGAMGERLALQVRWASADHMLQELIWKHSHSAKGAPWPGPERWEQAMWKQRVDQ